MAAEGCKFSCPCVPVQQDLRTHLCAAGQSSGDTMSMEQEGWYARELALWHSGLAPQDYLGLPKGYSPRSQAYAQPAGNPFLAAFTQFTPAELGMPGQALRPLYFRGEQGKLAGVTLLADWCTAKPCHYIGQGLMHVSHSGAVCRLLAELHWGGHHGAKGVIHRMHHQLQLRFIASVLLCR